jgi:hypothetical protein
MTETDDDTPRDRGTKGRNSDHAEDQSLFDRVVPEGFKRRIEAGVENVLRDGPLKALMGELKLPREIANHILSQVEETKHSAVGAIARETRQFLERTNLSEELAKLLTRVSFEIKTEVRFIPNEKAAKGGLVPKVKISGPKLKAKADQSHDSPDSHDSDDPAES